MDTNPDEIEDEREQRAFMKVLVSEGTGCARGSLHKNAAELAVRAKVRKRDVSLQTVTAEGTKANDTFMTIVPTAKKLGVSAYQYICDRVSNKFEMPPLAQIIREKKSLS